MREVELEEEERHNLQLEEEDGHNRSSLVLVEEVDAEAKQVP